MCAGLTLVIDPRVSPKLLPLPDCLQSHTQLQYVEDIFIRKERASLTVYEPKISKLTMKIHTVSH